MKIMTIYMPEKYIEGIDKIVKVQGNWQSEESGNLNDADFPTRSEFIRVAIREALIKYLDFAEKLDDFNNKPIKDFFNKIEHFNGAQNKKVIVPTSVKEFKTYKIIKRLEF